MSDLLNMDTSLTAINDAIFYLLDTLIYSSNKFNTKTNQNFLICTSKFIKDSCRFDNLHFWGTCIPLQHFSVLYHALYMTIY